MPASEVESLVDALGDDFRNARLGAPDLAMLGFAAKLTRTPGGMQADDVVGLRATGFDDRAIHDICAIAGYFAFVNRIADGLGVELEPRFPG
jgi:uncharacterized peroxidase-related enzyme